MFIFSSEGNCTLTLRHIQRQSTKCLLQVEGSCRLVSKQGGCYLQGECCIGTYIAWV